MRRVLFAFLTLLPASDLSALEFATDLKAAAQVRENEDGDREIPVNGYVGIALDQPSWHISSEVDLRSFRDFSRETDDFDLYQAVLHLKPSDAVGIDFGRQFLNEGFSVQAVDGLRTTLFRQGPVGLSLYGGIPRSFEGGDFNKDDGLTGGLSLALQNLPRANVRLHGQWRRFNTNETDLRGNDLIRAGLDASYRFDDPMAPTVYGLFEMNATGRVVEAATLGMDLYPSNRISLTAGWDYFDDDREADRPTVLGLFAQGRVLAGRFSSTWTLVPRWLDFVERYAFQRVEIEEDLHRSGHLLETGLSLNWEEAGLALDPVYYLSNSFGGTLHGFRAVLAEQFTRRLSAEILTDVARYTKVTGNNDQALSVVLWSSFEILEGWTLSAGMEYNRNNLFTHDLRGSMKMEFRYGTKG